MRWHRLKEPPVFIGLLLLVAAFTAVGFGRWDIGTFFLVWCCWLDQRIGDE